MLFWRIDMNFGREAFTLHPPQTGCFGENDMDILANNFEEDELKAWGMPDSMFDDHKIEVEIASSENITIPKKLTCPNCGYEHESSKT
jgi:hypothetical protein